MTTPKAILIGFALVALAVVFSKDVLSQRSDSGFYTISAAGENAAWRIDTRTGKVSHCRKEFANSPAKYGPWSK
ncbi:MAG: hypothetical protein ACKVHL_04785 [Rhodospirillales bacterium]|jgi:hypothetical protein